MTATVHICRSSSLTQSVRAHISLSTVTLKRSPSVTVSDTPYTASQRTTASPSTTQWSCAAAVAADIAGALQPLDAGAPRRQSTASQSGGGLVTAAFTVPAAPRLLLLPGVPLATNLTLRSLRSALRWRLVFFALGKNESVHGTGP
jgi:hypothetical protein